MPRKYSLAAICIYTGSVSEGTDAHADDRINQFGETSSKSASLMAT